MSPARRHRRIPAARRSLALGVALAALAAAPVHAQVAAEPAQSEEAAKDDAKELERVEVTGSSIKRIDGETASPLHIISRQQIEDMGVAEEIELVLVGQGIAQKPLGVRELERELELVRAPEG